VSDRLLSFAVAAVLIAAGGAAWWMQLRPELRPEPTVLADIPASIAGLQGEDVPIEQSVEQMLRADFHVQRAYRSVQDEVVWLYLGYYGTQRGGTPEHTPSACYTAHGWSIEGSQQLDVDPAKGLRVTEYVVEHGDDRRLVHYWYETFRDTGLVGLFELNLDHALGRMLSGRADGALVRISTPIEDHDEVTARTRLLAFATALAPHIAKHWPDEGPV